MKLFRENKYKRKLAWQYHFRKPQEENVGKIFIGLKAQQFEFTFKIRERALYLYVFIKLLTPRIFDKLFH